MKKALRSAGSLFLVSCLFLTGCYTVPETGRKAFILTPTGQDLALGSEAFQQIKAQEEISTDPEKTARVQEVGQRIAKQAEEHMPEAEWEFVLFEGDDTLNAFALPGGRVGVYTGLLDLAETDDALAVVIGHEIAHVTARHGAERMTRATSLALAGVGLGVATRDQDAQTREALMIAYGIGAMVGVELPFSRNAEAEADEIGLLYMARAGYDPRASIDFWRRMSEASSGASPPEFLSTHPAGETRIRELRKLMPKAMKEYEQTRTEAN